MAMGDADLGMFRAPPCGAVASAPSPAAPLDAARGLGIVDDKNADRLWGCGEVSTDNNGDVAAADAFALAARRAFARRTAAARPSATALCRDVDASLPSSLRTVVQTHAAHSQSMVVVVVVVVHVAVDVTNLILTRFRAILRRLSVKVTDQGMESFMGFSPS